MDKKNMYIAKDCSISGDISSSGNVTIDGEFEGSINIVGDLHVGESGKVKGNIFAENVTLYGEVRGNVNAKGIIEINAKGIVYGDILMKSLKIGQGARFIGNSTHTDLTEQESNLLEGLMDSNQYKPEEFKLEYKPIVYNRLAK